MARVGTTNFNLGKYLDGENPGSGPQDGTLGDGLNGDKNKIDAAMSAHNSDGSHKAAVIGPANLAATVVDGSSLEQNASTKKLNIKAGGVATAMLADDAVTKAKIAADVAGAGLQQNGDGSLSAKVDGSTITIDGSGQLSTVVQGRRQRTISGSPGVNGFLIIDGYQTTQALGFPVAESGCLTRITWMRNDGTIESLTTPYVSSGGSHFVANSKITVQAVAATKDVTTFVNSGVDNNLTQNGATKTVVMVDLQITYDN